MIDKSTRLKDRKQVQRVADTLEMAAQHKKSAQHVRAAFAQIFQDTYQETMSIATSRSYADQWLETKKPETARATLHSYSITISAFLDFLGSKTDRDLSEVARADLIAFRNSLAANDPEWQSLIKFGLYTGQRLGDLASLTWGNIDLEHQEIHLTTRKTGKRPLYHPFG